LKRIKKSNPIPLPSSSNSSSESMIPDSTTSLSQYQVKDNECIPKGVSTTKQEDKEEEEEEGENYAMLINKKKKRKGRRWRKNEKDLRNEHGFFEEGLWFIYHVFVSY